MFGKSKNNPAPAAANTNNTATAAVKKSPPSVISADMNILGNIISDGFLDIDGRIEGNVKCHSTTIRTQGSVKGDVIAEHIHIYGEVQGLVKATTVSLYASARVTGVIMHESLSIEDGAFVDGKFKRTDKVFIDDDLSEHIENESNRFEDGNVLDNLRLISH